MSGVLSTTELLAFNEELAALVAAGLPLPEGLTGLVRRRGALGALAGRLQQRLTEGESLTSALAAEGTAVPSEYAALVEAGVRAGRLPAALDSLTTLGSQMLQARRVLGAALRPVLWVAVIAYLLLITVGIDVLKRFQLMFDDFALATSGPTWWLIRGGLWLEQWWWVPLLLGAGLVWVWWRSADAGLVTLTGWARVLRWLPGAAGVLRNLQCSVFARLLATLVGQQVPLPEALRLAGRAVGDRQLSQQAELCARATEAGHGEWPRGRWPAYLDWTLRHRGEASALAGLLAHAGDVYERRAEGRLLWLRVLWPSLATVVLGGGVVLTYAWLTFGPLIQLWEALG